MINWEQFTVDNGAITDLRELMFTSTFQDPDLDTVVTTKSKQENGRRNRGASKQFCEDS